ncbi:MAG: peptidoglycan DD-metalloendopeptidase family protein [Methylophilaceae bacterium]|nr:peptidoglycan DD-metalloendopeptidase family protein [Methylophilaceae bacterium]
MRGNGLFAVFLLLFLLPVSAQDARPPSREALQELQSRIESLKRELDRTEEAHAEVSDALKQSEQAISEANRKLHELRQQQKENATTLEALRKDRSALESAIAAQQKTLREQLYRQYLNGQQSYLRALLEQRDPNAIARDLRYFSYVAKARAELIASLRKNLDKVATLDARTEATLKEIGRLQEAQLLERHHLQKQQAERKRLLQRLSAQLKAQRGEISRLERDEKRLSRLIERLARIVPKSSRKTPTSQDRSAPTLRNEVLPTPELEGSAFTALKGKLRLPVRGEVTNRFGTSREEGGITWKGLFIRAAEGEEVRAVANGQVVFADWLRGFGNLMILDHGGGYMSLYGNNQALLKRVGDLVKAGDVIAAVGNTGGIPESGLYFEMRHQSKPFDPLAWCVLK